jgi:hypothetical protein
MEAGTLPLHERRAGARRLPKFAPVDDQTTGPRSSALPSAFAHLAPQPAGPATRGRPTRPIRFTPSRTEPVHPRAPERAGASEQPSLAARLAAWVAVGLGWAVFAAWWVVVLQRESARALGTALGLLAAMLAASAVLMTLWTRHNIRIAKKGKRGRSSLFIPMEWRHDTLGRPLALPSTDAARTAPEVRLVLEGTTKTYVIVDAEEL